MKQGKYGIGLALIAFCLAGCLGPIGYDPEAGIRVNISGEIDANIRDNNYAVLWFINYTKSVHVTKIDIDRDNPPENTEYPKEYAADETQEPKRYVPGPGKVFGTYQVPAEGTYTIKVTYFTNPSGIEGSGDKMKTLTSQQFMRSAVDYKIFIYRKASTGEIEIAEALPDGQTPDDMDLEDSANPGPEIPGGANRKNTHPLIVKNLTKTAKVKLVDFDAGKYVMDPGPRTTDLQLVYLPVGQHEVKIDYTRITDPTQGGTAGPKNVVVLSSGDLNSWHTLYLYFYRTNNMEYSITDQWPPYPDDAAKDGEDVPGDIEDIVVDNFHGILEITNNSETGTVIKGILVDTNGTDELDPEDGDVRMKYPTYLYKDGVKKFIVETGNADVRFLTDKSGGNYGKRNPVEIRPKQTYKLAYYDTLGEPEDYTPGNGLIKIFNKTRLGYVTHVSVIDPDDTGKILSYSAQPVADSRFNPKGEIGPGSTGSLEVTSTPAVQIESGKQYWIQVIVRNPLGAGQGEDYYAVYRFHVIRDRTVDITINDSDLNDGGSDPGGGGSGGGGSTKIQTIINAVNQTSGAGITNVQVYSKTGSAGFAPEVPVLKPSTYTVTMKSSDTFPIVPNKADYSVKIILQKGADVYEVYKDAQKNLILYNRTHTFTITDGDLGGGFTPDPEPVEYTVTANGSPTADTTNLTFTFSEAVSGLTAAGISFTSSHATKGALTKVSDTVYELAVTANSTGPLGVKVTKDGVIASEKNVYVYKQSTTPPDPGVFVPVTDITVDKTVLSSKNPNVIKWQVHPATGVNGATNTSTHGQPLADDVTKYITLWAPGIEPMITYSFDNDTQELHVEFDPNYTKPFNGASRPNTWDVYAYVHKGVSETGTKSINMLTQWNGEAALVDPIGDRYPSDISGTLLSYTVKGKYFAKRFRFEIDMNN
ncbi:MAG: hypothetical protein LBD37_00815 [Treponema sp.]|jgi:hypothetical protein|nr:hypothetical protein [Treponema sp.]